MDKELSGRFYAGDHRRTTAQLTDPLSIFVASTGRRDFKELCERRSSRNARWETLSPSYKRSLQREFVKLRKYK
jgi:hypothetical protein